MALSVSEDAGTGGPLVVTSTAAITGLTPGRSYPFYLLVRANHGSDNMAGSSAATIRVSIDGTTYLQRSTQGTSNPLLSMTHSSNSAYTAYSPSRTFVASGTTANLTYTITVATRTGGRASSDDVYIQTPQWMACDTAAPPVVACPAPMGAFPAVVTNGGGNPSTGGLGWDNQGGNPGTSSGNLPEFSAFQDSRPSNSVVATTTGTMTGLVQGQTYRMAFNIKAGYGGGVKASSLHSIMYVIVGGATNADASVTGGTTLFRADTRSVADGGMSGHTVLDTGSGRYRQYYVTFVATGPTMSIAYRFQASWSPSQTDDDDIQITAPQFVNCL